MTTVAVLGGGQLGTMLAESLHKLDARVVVVDPHADAPARRRVPEFVCARWDDREALAEVLGRVDVVTYEFEHIDTRVLREVLRAPQAPPIYPSLDVLDTARDRLAEKRFLGQAGLPHARYASAVGAAELQKQAESFGYPFLLKTARGGYDGKGQLTLRSTEQLEVAIASLEGTVGKDFFVVIEEILPLAMEVSCVVARGPDRTGVVRVETFPVLENEHRGHILDFTMLPPRLPVEVTARVRSIAIEAAERLNVRGLLAVEFFLTKHRPADSEDFVGGYSVYVNELAPRPHNSGHVTRNACTLSQFDALARILMGLPPPHVELHPGGFCMGNLLGDLWLSQRRSETLNENQLSLSTWSDHPAVLDVVLYGKHGAKARRKMGHFVAWGADVAQARTRAEAFRIALAESSEVGPHLA